MLSASVFSSAMAIAPETSQLPLAIVLLLSGLVVLTIIFQSTKKILGEKLN